MNGEQGIRRIACDDTIPISILRDFVLQALRHDAICDVLTQRIVFLAERGTLDSFWLSAALPELISDVLNVVTNEDWFAIADLLIDGASESVRGEPES